MNAGVINWVSALWSISSNESVHRAVHKNIIPILSRGLNMEYNQPTVINDSIKIGENVGLVFLDK